MYAIYLNIFIFWVCTIIFSGALYIANFILFSLKEKRYRNKHSYKVYEFGTTTIGLTQTLNNSHFFILSTLFIIFDVEILYLYFWIAGITTTTLLTYKVALVIFIDILLLGLVYELLNGVLTWYKAKIK